MPANCYFVTGTDTDAGKSYVCSMLLQGFKALDITAAGVKPIAAGADAQGCNSDALLLRRQSGIALPYDVVNPICYQAPVAPHLAAINEQQPINEATLSQTLASWQQLPIQQLLVEGAGGWLLPISNERYLADWVAEHQLPVVLVVGMKLGCLNHAMLTVREIARSGCTLVGWVANCIDPDMALLPQNIADLQQRISTPCLGVVPYDPEDQTQLGVNLARNLLKTSGRNIS